MGSFDPIHVAHINIVRECLPYFDKIIIVPSGHNPWKKHNPAPFNLRIEMIKISTIPFGDIVEVSDIEGTFEPPYYANKSLNYFKEKYKDDEKYIICGSDTVEKIPYWKNAVEDIMPFYKVLCLERDTNALHEDSKHCVLGPDGKCYEYKSICVSPLPVSSTEIRGLIKNKKETYPLLPIEVSKIINDNNLYTD